MEEIKTLVGNNIDVVTIISIIVTGIISLCTLIATYRNNKKTNYINTITKNRVDWIYKLRELVSEFVSIARLFPNTSTKAPSSEETYKHMLKVSTEIKLMLNFLAKYDSKLMSLIDSIVEDYKKREEIQLIITTHENKLKQYQFDSSVFTDAHFIDFLIEYAMRKSITTLKRDEYIISVNNVNDLFTQINPNTKAIVEFCDCLYLEPERRTSNIDKKIDALIKTMQPYLKAEWDRVKVEAAGKKHLTVRRNKQINDFLKQHGENVFSEFNI